MRKIRITYSILYLAFLYNEGSRDGHIYSFVERNLLFQMSYESKRLRWVKVEKMIKYWQTEFIIFFPKTCCSVIQCLLHNSSRISYNELKIWIYRFFMMLFHFYLANIGVKFFESMVLLANVRYCHGPSLNIVNERFEK
jgi:hypothetical protein